MPVFHITPNGMPYDSRPDTEKHIIRVKELANFTVKNFLDQVATHDNTKLKNPEKEYFDIYTPKLKYTTYGSPEYKTYLKELQVALDHHYKHNRHHPEHFPNGINDMTLIDLLEMIIDWKASSERHDDGNIVKSIEMNKGRFGYDDQLANILKNTANLLKGV